MSTLLKTFTTCDVRLFLWIARRRRARGIAAVFRWVSRLGDGYLYLAAGLGLALFEPVRGTHFLAAGLLAFALELPLYLLLKHTIRRARPNDAIGHVSAFITPSDAFSFPSGHSAAAFVTATLVGHFYTAFLLPALLLAFLISLSRVILRVHYPTDILAGMILGLSCAVTALCFVSAGAA
ncbi:phosphatase PAP2 family protein [Desulfoluna spongiiphila]|uniref:Undecaprenyl-diphosphatase n=1 Tax=Desulfoluna spongiiphila TaxID=419481 RepID=A0A1G5BSW3_9BACT|nr:phosphatase PAP2 family protein [Desulfoluna spongiiphila]SCX93167.1 undecaprenyl-diphosphatase [Desulfoluna spongiiphila]VVS93889.1 phosphatidic acid phosphatase type 2/haloperoxidase [Desulfoluna spongiiphila]